MTIHWPEMKFPPVNLCRVPINKKRHIPVITKSITKPQKQGDNNASRNRYNAIILAK